MHTVRVRSAAFVVSSMILGTLLIKVPYAFALEADVSSYQLDGDELITEVSDLPESTQTADASSVENQALDVSESIQQDTITDVRPGELPDVVDHEYVEAWEKNPVVTSESTDEVFADDETAQQDGELADEIYSATPIISDSYTTIPDADEPLDAIVENEETDAKASAYNDEMATLVSAQAVVPGWNKVGNDYYWYKKSKSGALEPLRGWLVTNQSWDKENRGLQRYWLNKTSGALTFSSLLDPDNDGIDYYAYANNKGLIVRGKYVDKSTGYVYLANDAGRLEAPGWVVTKAYDKSLQRYWIDEQAHACIPGFSNDGWSHVTTNEGYVLRGAQRTGSVMRYANNDGRIVDGWVVTNGFGQGLQRYWQLNGSIVKNKLIQTGKSSWTYARPEGYVVRGKWKGAHGLVYLATNEGRLENPGWIVSARYDKSLQRYWIDERYHAAVPGYSPDGWSHYTTADGFVLRTKHDTGRGRVFVANNDGRLLTSDNDKWVVTRDFDGRLERYWVVSADHAARSGFFTIDGTPYFGKAGEGYVIRQACVYHANTWYYGNNDGKLTAIPRSVGKVGYQVPAGYPQINAYGVKLPGYCKAPFDYVMPCIIAPDATREQCIEAFIASAAKWLGTHWVDNRTTRPGDTVDCSGLIMEALYGCGVSLDGQRGGDYNPWTKHHVDPYFSNSWRNNRVFMPVSFSEVRRGDILYFDTHVAIWLGDGNILESTAAYGRTTLVHSAWGIYGPVLGVGRPFP